MPPVSRRTFAAGAIIAAVFALPASAAASGKQATASAPAAAGISLEVGHLRGGKAEILSQVPITGKLAPFVTGQQVQLLFFRNGHQVGTENVAVHGAGGKGSFTTRFRIRRGESKASATSTATVNRTFCGETTCRGPMRSG